MKQKTIALLCLMVTLGITFVLLLVERKNYSKLRDELAEYKYQKSEITENRTDEQVIIKAEAEPYSFEIQSSPMNESDYTDIMQHKYLSGEATIAYTVPYENDLFKCDSEVPNYSMLFPLGAVECYNTNKGAFDKWILVAWLETTSELYDTVGWIKLDQLTEYSESSKYITLFESSEKNDQYDIVREIADEIETVVETALSPASDTGDFVYTFVLDENEAQTAYIVNVNCILTCARAPEESPVIIGMYMAMDNLSDEEQKRTAQKVIDGYIAEMRELGERSQWWARVKAVVDENGKISLLYMYTEDGINKEMLLEDYLVEEDREQKIQLGIDTLIRDVAYVLKSAQCPRQSGTKGALQDKRNVPSVCQSNHRSFCGAARVC